MLSFVARAARPSPLHARVGSVDLPYHWLGVFLEQEDVTSPWHVHVENEKNGRSVVTAAPDFSLPSDCPMHRDTVALPAWMRRLLGCVPHDMVRVRLTSPVASAARVVMRALRSEYADVADLETRLVEGLGAYSTLNRGAVLDIDLGDGTRHEFRVESVHDCHDQPIRAGSLIASPGQRLEVDFEPPLSGKYAPRLDGGDDDDDRHCHPCMTSSTGFRFDHAAALPLLSGEVLAPPAKGPRILGTGLPPPRAPPRFARPPPRWRPQLEILPEDRPRRRRTETPMVIDIP